MAATGTPTPNIGLRRAQGTDPASVDDINYNSLLLDTKLGAVGNDSVQDQIDSLNSNITSISEQIAKQSVSCTAGSKFAINNQNCFKENGIVHISVYGYTTQALTDGDVVLTLPENTIGGVNVSACGYNAAVDTVLHGGVFSCANNSKNLVATTYQNIPAYISLVFNFTYKC